MTMQIIFLQCFANIKPSLKRNLVKVKEHLILISWVDNCFTTRTFHTNQMVSLVIFWTIKIIGRELLFLHQKKLQINIWSLVTD